jgi:hypothetical protein
MDYEILSIKTPSDKIFEVGNAIKMIGDNKTYGVLTRIWISNEQIRGDIGRLGTVLYTPEHEDIFEPEK